MAKRKTAKGKKATRRSSRPQKCGAPVIDTIDYDPISPQGYKRSDPFQLPSELRLRIFEAVDNREEAHCLTMASPAMHKTFQAYRSRMRLLFLNKDICSPSLRADLFANLTTPQHLYPGKAINKYYRSIGSDERVTLAEVSTINKMMLRKRVSTWWWSRYEEACQTELRCLGDAERFLCMLLPYLDEYVLKYRSESELPRPLLRLPCCIRLARGHSNLCRTCKSRRRKHRMSCFYTLSPDSRMAVLRNFLQYQFLEAIFVMEMAKNPDKVLRPPSRITFGPISPDRWDWKMLDIKLAMAIINNGAMDAFRGDHKDELRQYLSLCTVHDFLVTSAVPSPTNLRFAFPIAPLKRLRMSISRVAFS